MYDLLTSTGLNENDAKHGQKRAAPIGLATFVVDLAMRRVDYPKRLAAP